MASVKFEFSAEDEQLHTICGHKRNKTIVIEESGRGVALYGPYIRLDRGTYDAKILFDSRRSRRGDVEMDVCANSGASLIRTQAFSLASLGRGRDALALEFSLSEPVSDFEVRLHCRRRVSATITGIEIVGHHRVLAGAPVSPVGARSTAPCAKLAAHHLSSPRLFATREDMVAQLALGEGPVVAEIGVAQGDFSDFLIRTLSPSAFHAFDLFRLEQNDKLMGTDTQTIFRGVRHIDFYKDRFQALDIDLHLHIGDSADTMPLMNKNMFDLVYVDAGHYYNDVKEDALAAARMAKPDGVIIFNDYIMFDHWTGDPYGVVRAVNDLVGAGDWKIVGFALHEQMFCDIAVCRIPARWK